MRKAPLRIGYFADGIWGKNALIKLYNDENFNICFFTPRFYAKDTTLSALVQSLKIPIIASENVNSARFIQSIREFHCDVLVSMSFDQIFKKELLCAYPIINCHAGKLPFYRGRNPINWALINGEKEFGISVHFVDSGIDTGDLIVQRTYAIHDSDDYSTLLNLAYEQCGIVLYEALQLFADDSIQRIKQESIDKIGSYFQQRKQGDELIDFSKSTREIFNFIRALNAPDLGALAFIEKEPIRLYQSQIYPLSFDDKAPNGLIIALDEKGFLLKLKDGALQINKYAFNGVLKEGLILNGIKR